MANPDKCKVTKVEGFTYYSVNLAEVTPPTRNDGGETLHRRAAAALLGMPVSVLLSLRTSGHYKASRLGRHGTSFNSLDVEDFQARLKTLHHGPFAEAGEAIALREAWRMVGFGEDTKASVLADMLDGRVHAAGSVGESVQDLLVDANWVREKFQQARVEVFGDSMPAMNASKQLHCDPTIIQAMAESGHLEAVPGQVSVRVTRASVDRFGEQYCSLANMAAERGTSSRALRRRLVDAELIEFERGYGKVPQVFVKRGTGTIVAPP